MFFQICHTILQAEHDQLHTRLNYKQMPSRQLFFKATLTLSGRRTLYFVYKWQRSLSPVCWVPSPYMITFLYVKEEKIWIHMVFSQFRNGHCSNSTSATVTVDLSPSFFGNVNACNVSVFAVSLGQLTWGMDEKCLQQWGIGRTRPIHWTPISPNPTQMDFLWLYIKIYVTVRKS